MKKFDIVKAKRGAKVCTRGGWPVTNLRFNGDNDRPITGNAEHPSAGTLSMSWNISGQFEGSFLSPGDLVRDSYTCVFVFECCMDETDIKYMILSHSLNRSVIFKNEKEFKNAINRIYRHVKDPERCNLLMCKLIRGNDESSYHIRDIYIKDIYTEKSSKEDKKIMTMEKKFYLFNNKITVTFWSSCAFNLGLEAYCNTMYYRLEIAFHFIKWHMEISIL